MLRLTPLFLAVLVFGLAPATSEAETQQERSARLFAQKVKVTVDSCVKDKVKGNVFSFQTAFDCNCLASELGTLTSEDEFKNKKISWRRCFDATALSQHLLKAQCAYGSDCACVSAEVVSALANSDIAMTADELPFKWMGNLMLLKTQAEAACQSKK